MSLPSYNIIVACLTTFLLAFKWLFCQAIGSSLVSFTFMPFLLSFALFTWLRLPIFIYLSSLLPKDFCGLTTAICVTHYFLLQEGEG